MDGSDGCVFCEGQNKTTWMLTHLSPPATVHSCEQHAVTNLLNLVATLVEVDLDWLYGVVETAVNAEVAKAQAEPEPPAPPKKRARKATQPTPEMDAEVTDAAV